MSLPSTTYALALHTTTPVLELAMSQEAGETRYKTWNLGRDLATYLHQYLDDFIRPQTWRDLAFLAVAKGPGGFTGTRIGVVTARTLAQQLEIPLFGISTLAAIAWEGKKPQETIIAVQMPAQRNQYFVAIYAVTNSGITELLPDSVMTPETWQQTLKTWDTPYHLIEVEEGYGSSALNILELANLQWQQQKRPHWSETLPYYGQHPVTEK